MAAGRIEAYIHSDNITPNKGGALIKVSCQTDFAAKTDEFVAFSKKVARMAYAFGLDIEWDDSVTAWEALVEAAGLTGAALETERAELAKALRETVTIDEIVVLVL